MGTTQVPCHQCGQQTHIVPCDVARGAHANPATIMKNQVAKMEATEVDLRERLALSEEKIARYQAEEERLLEDRRRDRAEIDDLKNRLQRAVRAVAVITAWQDQLRRCLENP